MLLLLSLFKPISITVVVAVTVAVILVIIICQTAVAGDTERFHEIVIQRIRQHSIAMLTHHLNPLMYFLILLFSLLLSLL